MAPGFATVWEFSVKASRQAEFESHYGPDGSWARLFRQSPGYLGTELWHDRADALRYLTIDRWASVEAWREFRSAVRGGIRAARSRVRGTDGARGAAREFAPANATAR